MSSFVNDLLDLAQIEDGAFNLDKSAFSFHEVIHDVYLMFKRHAEIEDKKLIYNISKSFPPRIVGDKMRLQQVMINLIKNALKFTNKNGFVKINATYIKKESRILVKIQDTGIGISKKD